MHSGQRFDESLRHLIPPQVPTRENKGPDFRCQERSDLRLSIAEHLILGEDNPPPSADIAEPVLVLGVWGEVVLVDADSETVRTESLGENPIAEAPINEKGRSFRRLLL